MPDLGGGEGWCTGGSKPFGRKTVRTGKGPASSKNQTFHSGGVKGGKRKNWCTKRVATCDKSGGRGLWGGHSTSERL